MEIKNEIVKMIEKIEPLIGRIEIKDDRGEEMLVNMKAYISDSKHFLGDENYLKSFEAIVWAWAILEICEELDIFKIER
jgi:hypothetical protein